MRGSQFSRSLVRGRGPFEGGEQAREVSELAGAVGRDSVADDAGGSAVRGRATYRRTAVRRARGRDVFLASGVAGDSVGAAASGPDPARARTAEHAGQDRGASAWLEPRSGREPGCGVSVG